MDTGRGAPAALLLLVALATGGCGEPAEPVGVNRGPLDPDPIAGPCWPLDGVDRFGFAYQVRSDRFVDGPTRRRVVTLQYDRVAGSEVTAEVGRLLEEGGFQPEEAPAGAPEPGWTWVRRNGYGSVGLHVADLDVPEDNVVRGTLLLDLPRTSYERDASPPCPRPRFAG
jgi:hypothetical protein